LCNQNGHYLKAKALIDARQFHPWEGGEGKVSAQYQLCRIELAKELIYENNCKEAIELLTQCLDYPTNLGEGKLYGTHENEVQYWLGCAHEKSSQIDKAYQAWALAKVGNTEPAAAIFYNDQKPDKIFYQGLALLKFGRNAEACNRFNSLISYGVEHMNDTIKLDYFAVSLPDLLIWDDDLTFRNKIHCYYLLGLGYLGLGELSKAKKHLMEAAKMDLNHQGVQVHLDGVLKK
jgi:tetratricopeptide (TPR) repeat protein